MTEVLGGAGQAWLASAIGGHSDHAFVRDAGLRAADAAGHDEVMLYADFPYVIAYGWPSWVSGGRALYYTDIPFWVPASGIFHGVLFELFPPVVIRLRTKQRRMKTPGNSPHHTPTSERGRHHP